MARCRMALFDGVDGARGVRTFVSPEQRAQEFEGGDIRPDLLPGSIPRPIVIALRRPCRFGNEFPHPLQFLYRFD